MSFHSFPTKFHRRTTAVFQIECHLLSAGEPLKISNFYAYAIYNYHFLALLFQYQFLSEILKWRAQTSPDHNIFTLLNAKVSLN